MWVTTGGVWVTKGGVWVTEGGVWVTKGVCFYPYPYSISPENRKSITIFENINAAGDYPPPPLLVIQGHDMMSNWFADELPKGTRIVSSENRFTSDKIAIAYLQHYIENSDVGSESDWKLMLMDNHGSHVTPEFIKLANENRIRPYPLIPHLTHCMQPLDVGVFQPYIHWHDVAIQDAIAEFNVEYTITRFCQDLTKIRDTYSRNPLFNLPLKNLECGLLMRRNALNS